MVYTTSVQFLETLFGSGTRGARRMHQLANAVLIFDEIQTLPVNCVHLFNNAINFLADRCGSSVVLCTATQPLLNKVDASKGAIRIFTKVTASQHAVDKIRCNSVHPGPVDTEMFLSAFRDPAAMERRLQRIPLQRMGTVAEIVSAVLYLASDDSSYMTGSELVIDGGALAQ